MADDLTDPVPPPVASGSSVDERIAALESENAALKAKLSAYEPPPKPIQAYPKWVTKKTDDSIERVLVQNEDAHKALGEGWV